MLIGAIRRIVICLLLLAGAAAAQVSAPAQQLPEAPSSAGQPLGPPAKPVVAVPSNAATLSPAQRPYKPLTSKQKLTHFVRYSYSPYTMVNVLYTAAYGQATGDPYGYGGGMKGYGKRVGASLASTETGSFLGMYLLPSLLHQDPRYFPMYKGNIVRRGWHAATRVLVTRADDGHNTFNSSGLLAIAFNDSLKNAYLPEGKRGASITFQRMAGSVQGVASGYMLQEFMPDIVRLFRRHAPDKLKQIENKIPPQVLTGATTDQD